MSGAELILDGSNQVGESPVWHVRQQALYWVDIPARQIHRWSAGAGHRSWTAPEMVACIAPLAGTEAFVAGMQTGIFRLDLREDGSCEATPLAATGHAASMRFNDGRCDREGRFLAGTMELDMSAALPHGQLHRLAPDGRLETLARDMIVPNGMAFSPDGRRMYLSDSHPDVQRIWSFDYDADGSLSNRRLFVDMRQHPGRPDGAAVDADGCYWICGNDAGLVHRFTPEGRLDRSLRLPVKKPAMCAFGGAGLDTLFVTSIRPGGDLSDQPLAGGLFALRPGVRGLPEAECLLP